MKCNYKKTVQKKQNFTEFMFYQTYAEYYDRYSGKLKTEFYNEFYTMIEDINKHRLESGMDSFITLDMDSENQRAVYYDDITPNKTLVLNNADEIMMCYSAVYAKLANELFGVE